MNKVKAKGRKLEWLPSKRINSSETAIQTGKTGQTCKRLTNRAGLPKYKMQGK